MLDLFLARSTEGGAGSFTTHDALLSAWFFTLSSERQPYQGGQAGGGIIKVQRPTEHIIWEGCPPFWALVRLRVIRGTARLCVVAS